MHPFYEYIEEVRCSLQLDVLHGRGQPLHASSEPRGHQHDRRAFQCGVAHLANPVGWDVRYEPHRERVLHVDVISKPTR